MCVCVCVSVCVCEAMTEWLLFCYAFIQILQDNFPSWLSCLWLKYAAELPENDNFDKKKIDKSKTLEVITFFRNI